MTNLCVCTHLTLEDHTGAVDRIVTLANYVSKEKVNVYLINRSVNKSLKSLVMDQDKYYQIKSGVKTQREFPFNIRFLFPGPIKLLQEIINRFLSFLTFTVLSEVSLSQFLDPYLIIKLFYVCKKEKVDIIQCEFPITSLSAFIVKKILEIPLVFDSHNVETERMRSMANVSSTYTALTKLTEKTSCVCSDYIFVVSEKDKEGYATWGIPKQKIAIIPNSVEIQKFTKDIEKNKIRKYYNLNNKTVLIFHGDLQYPPNIEACQILVKSIFPQILKQYPQTYLLLVGRSPPKLSHPNIITTGFVENLQDYIAAADIAVVPLLQGGGTRIKIIQYLSCGKPTVSTIKGAEGLDLKNGQDILLTEQPDSKFINLVLQLIENKNLRKKIGDNARNKAELEYDWEKTATKAVQIYSNLIQSNQKNFVQK
jgi:polysaccharide biosynthesis protein PslH